jgi:hypothetical protein
MMTSVSKLEGLKYSHKHPQTKMDPWTGKVLARPGYTTSLKDERWRE